MAKNTKSFAVKGLINMDTFTLTEETKESIDVYDLRKVFADYDGENVVFSIKLEDKVDKYLADEQLEIEEE